MCMHTHQLFAQLAVKAAHHGDDNDQHPDAKRHPRQGDERDHGNKCALGFEITETEEELERQARHVCGRINGNRITSRMLSAPVSIMTRRSIPMPIPPAGGMPCSSASRKSSSSFSSCPLACISNRTRCRTGSFSSEYAGAIS